MDLRAQVKNAAGVTFSWNTTGLTDATSISGANTFDLTFTWDSTIAAQTVDSVTLTATSGTEQESQTYYFQLNAGTAGNPKGSANWPATLAPKSVHND